MRYADTYLKRNYKKSQSPYGAVEKRAFKSGQDPDWLAEQFLTGQGEFSVEASMAFDRYLETQRRHVQLGVLNKIKVR